MESAYPESSLLNQGIHLISNSAANSLAHPLVTKKASNFRSDRVEEDPVPDLNSVQDRQLEFDCGNVLDRSSISIARRYPKRSERLSRLPEDILAVARDLVGSGTEAHSIRDIVLDVVAGSADPMMLSQPGSQDVKVDRALNGDDLCNRRGQ